VPWIATDRYWLVRRVRILMGQVIVVLNLDLGVMLVNRRKSVVVLLTAFREHFFTANFRHVQRISGLSVVGHGRP